jgi:uncharacterized membrane protein YjdF
MLSAIYFAGLIWSGINPKDYYTWILEVTPGIIGFIVLAATCRKFRHALGAYRFPGSRDFLFKISQCQGEGDQRQLITVHFAQACCRQCRRG